MANIENARTLLEVVKLEKAKASGTFNMAYFLRELVPMDDGIEEVIVESTETANICGTTLCLAGHAALLAGWKFKFTLRSDEYDWTDEGYADVTYIHPSGSLTSEPDWVYIGIKYLDIDDGLANILFFLTFDDGTCAIDMLERIANGENLTDQEAQRMASEYTVAYRMGEY